MKYIVLLGVLFLVSCEKKAVDTCQGLNCAIVGEWEWVSTYGSIAGTTWTPESTGEERKLIVDDKNLSFYTDGQLTEMVAYEVFETDTLLGGNEVYTFCAYGGNTRLLLLEEDNLRFQDLCADCYDDNYTRIE